MRDRQLEYWPFARRWPPTVISPVQENGAHEREPDSLPRERGGRRAGCRTGRHGWACRSRRARTSSSLQAGGSNAVEREERGGSGSVSGSGRDIIRKRRGERSVGRRANWRLDRRRKIRTAPCPAGSIPRRGEGVRVVVWPASGSSFGHDTERRVARDGGLKAGQLDRRQGRRRSRGARSRRR